MLVADCIQRGKNNLDLIRLIAAYLVIISHAFVINPQPGYHEPLGKFFEEVSFGSIAVKVFFFISGLLVTDSIIKSQNIKTFTISRFFRIFPALIVVVTITALIIGPVVSTLNIQEYFATGDYFRYIVNNIKLNTQFTLSGVFENNPTEASVNGSLWTIRFEVYAYIVLGALFLVGSLKNRVVGSIICLIVILEPMTPFKGILFAIGDYSAIYLLASCFAFGSLFALNKDYIKLGYKTPLGLFLLYFFVQSLVIKLTLLYFSICYLCLVLSTSKILLKLKLKNDISYGVYLWGFPIQQIYVYYFDLKLIPSQIISIITASMLGYFSFKFIEQPFIQLGRKISKNIQKQVSIQSEFYP